MRTRRYAFVMLCGSDIFGGYSIYANDTLCFPVSGLNQVLGFTMHESVSRRLSTTLVNIILGKRHVLIVISHISDITREEKQKSVGNRHGLGCIELAYSDCIRDFKI